MLTRKIANEKPERDGEFTFRLAANLPQLAALG